MMQVPTGKPRSSRRAIWAALAAFGILAVLAGLMMLVVAYDPLHAAQDVSIVQTFLTWPVLGFTIVVILVVAFHQEVAAVLQKLSVKQVTVGPVSIEMQPEPPPTERPIELPPTITIEERHVDMEGTVVTTGVGAAATEEYTPQQFQEDMETIQAELQTNIKKLRAEATHWWHRYLATFLTASTQTMLRTIKNHPTERLELFIRDISWPSYAATIMRFRGYSIDGPDDLKIQHMVISMINDSLSVLRKYDLIEKNDIGSFENEYRITETGNEFLKFLDSAEGRDFLVELRHHRYDDGLPPYRETIDSPD